MAIDWSRYVRARLALSGVAAERELEIVEELAAQLDATYRRARGEGATEAEAEAAAAAEVPDWPALEAQLGRLAAPARTVATAHDGPSGSGVAGGLDDARQAARGLRSWRALPAAVGMLALAIGAILTAVATIDTWIVRDTPFAAPDRLVLVWPTNHAVGQPRDVVSGPTFLDWQRRATSFSALAAFAPGGLTLRRGDSADVLFTLAVTPGFFDVLGVTAVAGRTFVAEDVSRSGGVVLISHGVWQREFGGDPAVVGRTLARFGQPHQIVGVLPEDFAMLETPDAVTLLDPRQLERESRSFYNYWTVGRLRDGRSVAEAQQEMDVVAAALGAAYPAQRGWTATVTGYLATVVEPVRLPAFVLLAIAALVLCVGLGNAVHLLACRALDTRRDQAIRAALGASPARLRRLRVIESVALATLGGGLGTALAWGAVRLANTVAPATAAIAGSAATVALPPLALGATTLAAAVVVAAATAVALVMSVGLAVRVDAPAPADLRASSPVTAAAFTRGRRFLLGGQTAAATVLLAVAALFLLMVLRLMATSPGFDGRQVVAMRIGLVEDLDAGARARYYTDVLRAVKATPSVLDAALNDYLPLTNEDDYEGVEIPGQVRDGLPVAREEWRRVSAGYFTTLGIPLVRGRGFRDGDDERTASVVVVNEAFARKYWAGADPIGTRVRITSRPYGWSEVVGVVGDVREVGLDQPAKPMMFVPYHREPRPVMGLFVRTRPGVEVPLAEIRRAIWSVDPTRPIVDPQAMSRIVGDSYAVQRATLWGAGTMAGLAWLLMLGGVYAIVSVIAAARGPEIGVRRALGADSRQVLAAVMARPCGAAVAGMAIGVAGALAAAPALQALVPGLPALDLRVTAAVVGLIGLAVVAAGVLPARRALAVDPLVALRAE